MRTGRYAGHGRSATAGGILRNFPLAVVIFMAAPVIIRVVKIITVVE